VLSWAQGSSTLRRRRRLTRAKSIAGALLADKLPASRDWIARSEQSINRGLREMGYAGVSLTLLTRSFRIDFWNQSPFRTLFGRHSAHQVRQFKVQDLGFHAATQIGVTGFGAAAVKQAEHRFPLLQPNS